MSDAGVATRSIDFRPRVSTTLDLGLPGLPKNKVLAIVVTLLDETLIRVGNEESGWR